MMELLGFVIATYETDKNFTAAGNVVDDYLDVG